MHQINLAQSHVRIRYVMLMATTIHPRINPHTIIIADDSYLAANDAQWSMAA